MGNVVPVGDAVGRVPLGSPPTSYAAYGVVEGHPGALLRMGAFTLLRSMILAPGLALAGIRGRQLIVGSLGGSLLMSTYAVGCALYSKMKSGPDAPPPLPTIDAPVPDEEPLETEGEEIPVTGVS